MIAIDAKFPERCADCRFCEGYYCTLYKKQIGKNILDVMTQERPHFCKIINVLKMEDKKLVSGRDVEIVDSVDLVKYVKQAIAKDFAERIIDDLPFYTRWIPELDCYEIKATVNLVGAKELDSET